MPPYRTFTEPAKLDLELKLTLRTEFELTA